MSKPRTRRTRIGVFHVTAQTAWSTPTITLNAPDGDSRKEVIIQIQGPSDLTYLEERFEEIRAYWRRQLGA